MELCREHFPELDELRKPNPDADPVKAYWKAVSVAKVAQEMRDKELSKNERLRLEKREILRTNLELCYLWIRCSAYEAKKFAKYMALSWPLLFATFVLTLLVAERYYVVWATIYAMGCYQLSEPIANLIRKRFTK